MSDIDNIENQHVNFVAVADDNLNTFNVELKCPFQPDLIEVQTLVSGNAPNTGILKSSLSKDFFIFLDFNFKGKIKLKSFTNINSKHTFYLYNASNVLVNLDGEINLIFTYIKYKPREPLPRFKPDPVPLNL